MSGKLVHSDAVRLAIYAEKAGMVLTNSHGQPDGDDSTVYGTWQDHDNTGEPIREMWLTDFTTSELQWWGPNENTDHRASQYIYLRSDDPAGIATALLMLKCWEVERATG